MRARPGGVYHDRGWRPRAALLGALCLIAVAFLSPGASAATIAGDVTLQEGEYYFLGIQNPYPGRDWVIDANWTASDPIDMWVMNRTDFQAYEANQSFGFEQYHQGSFFRNFVQIKANRAAEEPFYLVFDNTDKGNNHPVADIGNHVPHIVVTGLTREDGMVITGTPSDGGFGVIMAIGLVAIIGVPALFVAQRVMGKKKKARELEDIRRRLHAGEVVGKKQAPPPPPPPKAPPPPVYTAGASNAPLPVPVSPSITSSAQLEATKAAAAAQTYCGRCGSALERGIRFCGRCGAPV